MLDGIRLVGSYDSHGEPMGGYAMRACVRACRAVQACRACVPCRCCPHSVGILGWLPLPAEPLCMIPGVLHLLGVSVTEGGWLDIGTSDWWPTCRARVCWGGVYLHRRWVEALQKQHVG
jgi:hypothetical protein